MTLLSFQNEVNKYLANEIIPVLSICGFHRITGMRYVREKDGLLQFFHFRIEKYKLRPWFYFLPIFEGYNGLVEFGADGINVQDCLSPFNGYANVFCPDRRLGGTINEWEYANKILPKLEKLKYSIQNGLLPVMDSLDSLDKFVQRCKNREKIMLFDWGGKDYFLDFVLPVCESCGAIRMNYILQNAEGIVHAYPKELRTFLGEECQTVADNTLADQVFENIAIWFARPIK